MFERSAGAGSARGPGVPARGPHRIVSMRCFRLRAFERAGGGQWTTGVAGAV